MKIYSLAIFKKLKNIELKIKKTLLVILKDLELNF